MLKRSAILAAAMAAAWPLAARAELWDGPKLKPTPRQEVYEFTIPPTFAPMRDAAGNAIKDRYVVHFASKARCDVAVAVEDAAGRIVNHVGYGVLGPNAPFPFKADSLAQTLVWDGKDDLGKYVPDPGQCRARVSLGLKATFDKIIGHYPKDTIGQIEGLGADANGVYVMTCGGYWWGIRAFDHDGNYLRTLLPFPADKLDEVARAGVPLTDVNRDGSYRAPIRDRYGQIQPFNGLRAGTYQILVVHDGVIHWTTKGHEGPKQVLRLGTNGSYPAGQSPVGPIICNPTGREGGFAHGASEMAISPDGKWLYVTKCRAERWNEDRTGRKVQHAVFRLACNDPGPISLRTNVFVGEAVKAGDDNDHLNRPEGVAVDAAGRVYVSDTVNNRIQVFSPEGKHLQTIKAAQPRQIQVHQKTGQIYYLSYAEDNSKLALVKLSALPAAKELARLGFDKGLTGGGAQFDLGDFKSGFGYRWQVVFCLDSWSTPARVWIQPAVSRLLVFNDAGDKFELFDDFNKDILDAGYTPHAFNNYKMNRISADPKRSQLWYLNSLSTTALRVDPEVGRKWDRVSRPEGFWTSFDELYIGFDGLLYLRAQQYLGRFDPDKIRPREATWDSSANYYIPLAAEIPFDYGEVIPLHYANKSWSLKGGIALPAQLRGNGFDQGMGVSPLGEVMVLCANMQKQSDRYESRGTTVPPLVEDRYRPAMFPGRKWDSGELVFIWDRRGELIGEDVVQSMQGQSDGIRGDKHGGVYVGLAAHPLDAHGKLLLPRNDNAGPGALLKFNRDPGGKIFGTWGNPVKLDPLPARPPEFQVMSNLWTQGMLWSYPGMSTMTITVNTCCCPQSRFDTDVYGRSFVPESWRFSVGVVDTNGNPIMHIGRYGNPESGAGAASKVPVEGGIAFSQCDYLSTVTDKWLYVNDTGNWRIVRLKLDYHVNGLAPLTP